MEISHNIASIIFFKHFIVERIRFIALKKTRKKITKGDGQAHTENDSRQKYT